MLWLQITSGCRWQQNFDMHTLNWMPGAAWFACIAPAPLRGVRPPSLADWRGGGGVWPINKGRKPPETLWECLPNSIDLGIWSFWNPPKMRSSRYYTLYRPKVVNTRSQKAKKMFDMWALSENTPNSNRWSWFSQLKNIYKYIEMAIYGFSQMPETGQLQPSFSRAARALALPEPSHHRDPEPKMCLAVGTVISSTWEVHGPWMAMGQTEGPSSKIAEPQPLSHYYPLLSLPLLSITKFVFLVSRILPPGVFGSSCAQGTQGTQGT